ncbi:MAG: hypothetical protein KME33_21755 [Aetokthonos hydrillicola CCALA 1050]|nr:hypothetical protein [Aetokthonos hydrillicola CCALA 1050]
MLNLRAALPSSPFLLGIGHWAWGNGHGAMGIGHWALGIGHGGGRKMLKFY